jgi:hypothetical protein
MDWSVFNKDEANGDIFYYGNEFSGSMKQGIIA